MDQQPRMAPLNEAPPVYTSPAPTPGPGAQPKKGLAVASLVLGICSICLGWVLFSGVVTGSLAIIFGAMQIRNVNRDPRQFGGKGLAVAGLVLGIIALAFFVMGLLFLGAMLEELERDLSRGQAGRAVLETVRLWLPA